MRLFTIAALATTALTTTSFAADMPAMEPVGMASVEASDWSGFYAGLQVGYSWLDTSNFFDDGGGPIDEADDLDTDGVFGGAHIGYNMQSGNFVYGLEGDVSGADLEVDDDGIGGDVNNLDLQLLSTVRGRIGYAFGSTLLFATGGVAIGLGESTASGETEEDTSIGFTVGGGVEHMFSERLSARIEYRYTQLDDFEFEFAAAGYDETFREPEIHSVSVGLSYHF